ncbi:MAG: riboflavin biosynthesis protein RibF [Bacteroidales bacterium]|nr:riboflavin biosynthesis protein RibF [Bacteroidales bacterium]
MFKLYDIHGPLSAIPEPTAVTVGVFDGVHRGHQDLIKQLSALRSPLSTLVVTLTAHPSFVLGRRDSEYWLDDREEHLRLLFEAGAKYVAVLPFTREVAQLSACAMARLLYDKLNMRALLLGYDSRFGSKQDDNFDRLPLLASELGFTLLRGEPFLFDGTPISSSRIRESLLQGRVDETARLLGRPYSVCGRVAHGRGVGHTLGFPTANIDLSQTRKMLPLEGVYAVKLRPQTSDLRPLTGMANLGPLPTFGIDKPTLEVHLLDFDGDLYGQPVEVQFIQRLRDTVRFDSVEALQHQLQEDLNNCQQICRQDAGAPKQ